MTELQVFEVNDFELHKGGVLPSVRLVYHTEGTLNADRSNAVLIPSWYGGNDEDSSAIMTGPGRAIDPERHFIIFTNLLGGGRSSSPSNTAPPYERGRFPRVTLLDNVRLQHRLVTEALGLERLRLVTGASMGACQTYQWAATYPDMVRAAVPMAGSARTAEYNRLFLLSLRRALELDPEFREGFYDRPPVAGLRVFSTIYAGWGLSEPFYRNKLYRGFGARTFAEFVANFWEPIFLKTDANDLLCMLDTWFTGDIADNATYDGDLDAALGAIKAKTIILQVDLDRYFPPEDAMYEASKIPGAECVVLRSDWGHMATGAPQEQDNIDAVLRRALEEH